MRFYAKYFAKSAVSRRAEGLQEDLPELDVRINAIKSTSIRFERRHDAECENITVRNCDRPAWVSTC